MIRTFDDFDLPNKYQFSESLDKVGDHKELNILTPILIQMPKTHCIEDIDFTDKSLSSSHFKVRGSKSEQFKQYMDKLDEWVVEYICKNSEQLFNKNITKDNLISKYIGSVSDNDNIKLYLPRTSRGVKLNILDADKEPINIMSFKTGDIMRSVIRCRKVIIYKREIFPQWEMVMVNLKEKKVEEPKQCMIEIDSDEDDDETEIYGDF